MVRKRGTARTSFARRRMRRVKKYDHNVIPIRFKLQLGDMSGRIESPLDKFVACETPTMNKLADLGVPTEEYPYYIGFMKEMLSIYLRFIGDTLIRERVNLLEEYLLRGKDVNVLIALDEVAAGCAGVPYVFILTCNEVKACLEGDYTSWVYQWTFVGQQWDFNGHILRVDETNNFIQFITNNYYRLMKLNLTTGALISRTDTLNDLSTSVTNRSLLGKYVAYVLNDGGIPKLLIEKDGTLQQTINLSQAPISWLSTSEVYYVSVSTDGKYILVWNDNVREYVLFKGS